MPRPGQQAARRKRARVSTTPDPSTNREEQGSPNPRARCLPVADLPADFDGMPENGAQYLAMVMRNNEELPWSTRMEGWTPAVENETEVRPDNGQPAGRRHMALPQGSWEVLFPLHFQNYRKNLAESWPPSPPLSYPQEYPPLPEANRRSEWYMFINGYPMEQHAKPLQRGTKGKEKALELTEEEVMNEGANDSQNAQEGASGEPSAELKGNRGKHREPLVSVVQGLNSNEAVRILSHFAHWLTESITQLPTPFPTSPELLPTQPDGPMDPPSPASSSTARPPNPFPPHYAQWILALLMIVDSHLSGGQISTLRDLARAAMRVAGWRWIRGVVVRDVNEGWKLGGQGWRLVTASTENEGGEEENVDEMLARCWVVVHAVVAGWAQRDLLDDLENLFK
ncbi:hypothetical protein C343_07039 [Cryptococcus neoformans C23]|uniref:Uncharacterized protein n=1 Tax=Cryptococcus neoformans (strain H99 / ATCC 208821 / CBS 10515 / FGSC 9487) TaxID=235443 RepID=J9W208_CRYN9|nr:hypothetical protein CNAG_05624 [Cryptococcus neoformans var. grubii H99]AUB29284.1 hypothetical protein CKF44_05624 [Cryptococcus neoformans var. grubii]OWZ25997.1 hypothetical protein C347_06966 [Cryptococcus neoformans var. grubii AD2-60a]OWZ38026.1 hypothetical protein C343_07039 [Cryptococcus neoformans var. grubii C23]OWZ49769.1 hypothetical protein C368_07043 [Cryptococcus neoformans var. grubii 125.91]OXC80903.1 hypothetical protein C344_06939 [Cryptococcus neoformans var. grubii AD|eukprot:XP_012053681.1 hypothetical protein CNAG_05624 [Cryptococcus neoformans var. grubii H99]